MGFPKKRAHVPNHIENSQVLREGKQNNLIGVSLQKSKGRLACVVEQCPTSCLFLMNPRLVKVHATLSSEQWSTLRSRSLDLFGKARKWSNRICRCMTSSVSSMASFLPPTVAAAPSLRVALERRQHWSTSADGGPVHGAATAVWLQRRHQSHDRLFPWATQPSFAV